jgi:hypothetical protein
LRAHCTRAGRRRRADGRRRTTNFWAAGARAGWTVATLLLPIFTCINDNRLLLRHGRFEHILGKVWNRGAFTLQHVVVHIGRGRARRDAGLQDVFGEIWNGSAGRRVSAFIAGRILKSFLRPLQPPKDNIGKKEPKKKGDYKRF